MFRGNFWAFGSGGAMKYFLAILLMLALTKTNDPNEIKRMFEEY